MKFVIELTDSQLKKLGELVNIEIKDDGDVKFAIEVLLQNL
jgi:hypothetical protein